MNPGSLSDDAKRAPRCYQKEMAMCNGPHREHIGLAPKRPFLILCTFLLIFYSFFPEKLPGL